MLVLLPPSEGKTVPVRGRRLELERLGQPELTPTRQRILDALVELCRDPSLARVVLGLGPTQDDAIAYNAGLHGARTARADRVYSGVLYEALGIDTLEAAARRRATRSLVVTSALFGLVRLSDPIPAYRLSGAATLPGIGPVAACWRGVLGGVLPDLVGSGVLLDLRSQTYAGFFRVPPGLARRTASVRILNEHAGVRSIVSHFNKVIKGRLVRSLLRSGAQPRSVSALEATLRDLGWTVEREGSRLDVIVSDL